MDRKTGIILAGLILITGGVACCVSRQPTAECISTQYVVSDGDTLWEIAEDTYGKDADIRKAVHKIMEINDCTGEIYPGDVIALPEK